MKKRFVALLIPLMTPVPACGLSGTVVDKATSRPIPNAAVIVTWDVRGLNPVDASSVCKKLDVLMTDQRGQFRVPITEAIAGGVGKISLAAVYKPGFHFVEGEIDYSKIYMEQNSSDRALRLKQIVDMYIPYDCPSDDRKKLITTVLMPAYSEAKPLAVTAGEWDKADGFLRAAERIEMGGPASGAKAEARRSTRPKADWSGFGEEK